MFYIYTFLYYYFVLFFNCIVGCYSILDVAKMVARFFLGGCQGTAVATCLLMFSGWFLDNREGVC